MRQRLGIVLALIGHVVWIAAAMGQAASPAIVMDTMSPWRSHATLAPPVMAYDDGPKPILVPQRWMNRPTSPPPADWTAREFDDSTWVRGTALRVCHGPHVQRLRLRGAFSVTDPQATEGLALTLRFHGGAVVYLNGAEIARAHVPAGPVTDQTMAEAYPAEAFVTVEGEYLAPARAYLKGKPSPNPSADSAERMKQWVRTLDAQIPAASLKPGPNVLAIEIFRAPLHPALDQAKTTSTGSFPYEFVWDTARLLDVQLTAPTPAGVLLASSRPAGMQLWTSDPMAGDFDIDYGNPAEPLRPITLVGARNGSYSGKVVLGSSKPIRGLQAAVSDLTGPAGRIPAAALRVRYGQLWGSEQTTNGTYHAQPSPHAAGAALFGMLVGTPPQETPIRKVDVRGRAAGPAWATGATCPIWVTVGVPADAAPGDYAGALTVTVAEGKPTSVPITLTVVDWTLPDPADYRTWVELMQSPDTLAVEYGVELWSQAHWDLIAMSMDYLREVGSGVLYVPLLAQTNLGNAESMVRWIPKGAQYTYDFSIMDRYLDLAAERMGTIKMVVFNVWDIFLIPQDGGINRGGRIVKYMDGQNARRGMGPLVTIVDPATGATRNDHLPRYEDPAAKGQWGPLMKQLRERMADRGLAKAMMLGMITDAQPSQADVTFFNALAPGVPWVSHGHGGFAAGQKLHGIAPVGYQACVWYTQFPDQVLTHGRTWGPDSLYGWKQDQLTVAFERNPGLDSYPPTRWRVFAESNIVGGQRGVGRLGADFWPVIKDSRGRRRGTVSQRYPDSLWMNLNVTNALLAPGPDGPVATTKFEAFREGIQECEARIFIERALTDPTKARKLPADLAERCRAMLEQRTDYIWKGLSSMQLAGPGWANAYGWRWTHGVSGHLWFLASGWQQRSELLYVLAGEVDDCLGRD